MKAPTLSYWPTPCRGAGRRFLILAATGVLLSGIFLPFGPRHVLADGGAAGTGAAQNAARGPVEQRIYDLKTQIAADLSQGITPPTNLTQELDGLTGVPRDYNQRNLTTPPPAGSPPAPPTSVSPDSGGGGGTCTTWCYAPVDGGVSNYEEPTFDPQGTMKDPYYFPNQCGPGSATKLISGWMSAPNTYNGAHYVYGQDTPPQGYMLWLGLEMGMMNHDNNQWSTYAGKEASVIDTVLHNSYYTYGTDYYGTVKEPLSTFNSQADFDLGVAPPYALVLETWSTDLNDGWTHQVAHDVAVNGDNDNLAEIEYFDSAYDSAAYGVHVVGFHYELRSLFGSDILDTVW